MVGGQKGVELSNSANACKISLVSQEKNASKCIRIASTDILNYIFSYGIPLTRGAPTGLGDLGRMAIDFQGAEEHW